MNDLSIVNVVTAVIQASRNLYLDYNCNKIVSSWRKQALRIALDEYVAIRKANSKAHIFDENMNILEKAYKKISNIPKNTPYYDAVMSHFYTLSEELKRLLEDCD